MTNDQGANDKGNPNGERTKGKNGKNGAATATQQSSRDKALAATVACIPAAVAKQSDCLTIGVRGGPLDETHISSTEHLANLSQHLLSRNGLDSARTDIVAPPNCL